MSKLWKLIRLFQQSKGRSPSPSELANLKKQAEVVVEKEKIIRPDFGGSLKEFTRKEDLYEGNKKGLEKLLKSGAVKKGVAPKTKKTKDPVDPKFKRAVESQEERARLIKEFEARNKDSAFNFAFKKYKDIDRKPMEMDEVISIYTNLNKYPKGRDIIVDDIMDIQRRHILPNIGNRSRDDLVNKLNQMIRPKKQPNPFKKAPDEVTDQIEMDFTDWDPKGMKGGGIAHMLGQPRVGMMYGGDPGFAFEYGGSWADWRDNHQHMMPVTEYIGTKLPKDRLPFRQELSGGGLAGLPPVTNMIGPPLPAKPKRMNPNPTPPLTDLPKHDFSQPFYQFRKRFKDGGFDKGRRNFMKMAAGLASLPFVGKLFKGAKAIKAAKTIKLAPATGMPDWFPSLVNKVIKEGDDVTQTLGTVEREIVHTKKLSETEAVTVYNNLDNGHLRVEYGGPEFDKTGKVIRASNDPEVVQLEYISPKEITSGKHKGKKTDAEFGAAESEPEVVNWDGDIEWSGIHEVNRVEDLTSDVSRLKQYATGKNPTIKEILDTSKKKTYRQNLETDTMEQIDYIENRHGGRSIEDYIDEAAERGDLPRGADVEGIGYNLPTKKAKGGLAHMLGR